MELEFTEEQEAIRDMTRALLEEHSSVEVVRQAEDDAKGFPDALWKQMAESGLVGLLIHDPKITTILIITKGPTIWTER